MKVYDKLQDLFDDGIFTPYDILIIWGARGTGKSSLMGKLESEFMRPENAKKRIEASEYKCKTKLRPAGILISPPEDHIVFTDTFFEDNGFHGDGRRPYEIKTTQFCLPNQTHKDVLPLPPYASVFLDEVQDVYDSHEGTLPPYVSKGYELSRQPGYFVAMACQRPIRISKDIRDIATFVETESIESMYIRGNVISSIWTLNIIYHNSDLERYIDTRDKSLIDKRIQIIFRGNIFECYDTDFFLPMFYTGFEGQKIIYKKVERTEFTPEGLDRFKERRVIDIPKTFRGKADKTTKEEEKSKSDRKGTERPRETEDN